MSIILALAASTGALPATDRLAVAREAYRVTVRACRAGRQDDIIVCGRRAADKWRVPILAYDAGDPRGEGVAAARDRLFHRTTPCQDRGPFLIGCGFVGVRMTTGIGAGAGGPRLRTPSD